MMGDTESALEAVCAKDPRYRLEAYLFVLTALEQALRRIGRRRHQTGQELSEGIRLFALEQYGLMAKTVLETWGCTETDDFGNIVYNMIEARIMSKTPEDRLEDFHAVYDFAQAFTEEYQLGQDQSKSR
jgi:uncharacterized repeat protein (TIGR04138 family)